MGRSRVVRPQFLEFMNKDLSNLGNLLVRLASRDFRSGVGPALPVRSGKGFSRR